MKTKMAMCLPVVWFLVAVSTLAHYERNWEGGTSFSFDGFSVNVVLSIILAIVLVIRIFRRVEDILIAKGTIKSRVSTPYDLFPVPLLFLFFGIGFRFFGDAIQSTPLTAAKNQTVYQWVFEWGVNENKFLIYLAILGLILLYRIHQLLAAVRCNMAPSRSSQVLNNQNPP
jgi:hypothetical protein